MRFPSLLVLSVLATICAGPPSSAAPKPAGHVGVSYVAPKHPELRPIHDAMRSKRVLERVASVVGELRLPRRLTLKLDECGGEPNAWYDPEKRAVTLCYEYLRDIADRAPSDRSPEGVTRQEALVGPVFQVLLHETGHAIFDLLDVPILGREEDAADQVAAFAILRLGPKEAREVIDGSAYLFVSYAREEKPEKDAYADVHGLSAQRFYNLVCLAYGSDPKAFGYVVEKSYLPKDRAEGCGEEYDQVAYAFQRLIGPSLRSRTAAVRRLRRELGQRR